MAKKAQARKQRALVEECRCCHVNFDPNICPQCQVAGCAAKAKDEKCRLSAPQFGARKLSPFQLQQRVVDLQTRNADLEQQVAELLKSRTVAA
jgi:hypothetical protein